MYPVRKVYLRVQIRRPFADGTAGRLAIQKKERTGRSKFTKGILSDMNQKRIAAVAVLAAASAVTSVIAVKTGVDPPPANIAGAFASILVLVIAAKLLKATDDLFYCGIFALFLYFAEKRKNP